MFSSISLHITLSLSASVLSLKIFLLSHTHTCSMKETKFDRLLQRCCNSSKTGRPKTISPLLPPNNHFYSPHTNHQRTWPIQSSIIQTHSTAPHAQKYPKQSLTNSLNYLQVIVFLLVMCLLKSACAEIPHRCLQEFTFLDCGTQLVTRWTYDSVNMQCKDNIEWPCEEYDDTTNSFDTLQECNRVCRKCVCVCVCVRMYALQYYIIMYVCIHTLTSAKCGKCVCLSPNLLLEMSMTLYGNNILKLIITFFLSFKSHCAKK